MAQTVLDRDRLGTEIAFKNAAMREDEDMRFHFMVDVKPVGRKLKRSSIKRLTDTATSAAMHAITENIPFDADIEVTVKNDKAYTKAKGGSR